jgi:K+-transporting ATPase ATPase A chain
MGLQDFAEPAIVALVCFGAAPFLGAYMARVYRGERHPLSFLAPLERLVYRLSGIDPEVEMGWREYAAAVVGLGAVSIVVLALLLMGQGPLPLNPRRFPGLSWDLALNTAVSFVTNTNWQAYSGEVSLGYLSQAAGLVVQNFLSAAVGMSVAVALVRGIIARREEGRARAPGLGDSWVDATRSVIYVLLPLSLVVAIVLAVPFVGIKLIDLFLHAAGLA